MVSFSDVLRPRKTKGIVDNLLSLAADAAGLSDFDSSDIIKCSAATLIRRKETIFFRLKAALSATSIREFLNTWIASGAED